MNKTVSKQYIIFSFYVECIGNIRSDLALWSNVTYLWGKLSVFFCIFTECGFRNIQRTWVQLALQGWVHAKNVSSAGLYYYFISFYFRFLK
jgi:hypothetical protein